MKADYAARLTVLLSFSLLLLATPSYADSDGCYCKSKGYIAFELRSFHTPGLQAPHILKVFRFESSRGIYEAGEAPMEDFQVDEMICNSDRVEISGFGKEYMRYVIAIAGESNKPRITQHVQDANRQHDPSKQRPAPGQLGLSRPAVIPLESSDAEHKYQLVLSFSTNQVKGGVENIRKAELLQIDLGESVSQRVLLYEDRYTDSGGEYQPLRSSPRLKTANVRFAPAIDPLRRLTMRNGRGGGLAAIGQRRSEHSPQIGLRGIVLKLLRYADCVVTSFSHRDSFRSRLGPRSCWR